MAHSLQKRLSAILVVALALLGVTSFLILRNVVAPAFNALESRLARTDLERAALVVDGQLQQIRAIVGDWAPWDEAYDFAAGTNPGFVDRNITAATLQNLDVDLMQFFDSEGQRLWVGYIEEGQFEDPRSLGSFLEDGPVNDTLTKHRDATSVISGALMTERGLMLLVSMPLVPNTQEEPLAGTVMMGRLLTDERLQALRGRIKVAFDLVQPAAVLAEHPRVLERFDGAAADAIVQTAGEGEIFTWRLIRDVAGDPLALLQTVTQRDVTTLGNSAADLALMLFVITSLLLVGVVWYLLRHDIVAPLGRLTAHIAAIRRSGELSSRLPPSRDDEIGRLAGQFNALTGELQQARRQLVDRSFNAGRADIAADVLHNIRNAMTPVLNLTDELGGAVEEVSALHLRQAAAELASEGVSDARRQHLLRYVAAAAERLAEISGQAADDLDVLRNQTRMVEDILASQEGLTRALPLRQHVNLADLVSEAVEALPSDDSFPVEINLSPDLEHFSVTGNPVHLLQIFGTVMLNACEAVRRRGSQPGRIDIEAATTKPGVEMVTLSISDSGMGMGRDTMTRLFQRGFSLKDGMGSGSGLHWCANAVNALGGSIRAESGGPGQGTTVLITLPAVRSARSAEDPKRPRAPVRQP